MNEMKRIKIYHSAYDEKDFHISESAPIDVDLSELENSTPPWERNTCAHS